MNWNVTYRFSTNKIPTAMTCDVIKSMSTGGFEQAEWSACTKYVRINVSLACPRIPTTHSLIRSLNRDFWFDERWILISATFQPTGSNNQTGVTSAASRLTQVHPRGGDQDPPRCHQDRLFRGRARIIVHESWSYNMNKWNHSCFGANGPQPKIAPFSM